MDPRPHGNPWKRDGRQTSKRCYNPEWRPQTNHVQNRKGRDKKIYRRQHTKKHKRARAVYAKHSAKGDEATVTNWKDAVSKTEGKPYFAASSV